MIETQIAFDIIEAEVVQDIRIIHPDYNLMDVIDGLCDGTLVTSTWHSLEDETYIDVTATGEHVALILAQEINGGYVNFG